MNITHAHGRIPCRESFEELFNLVASSFIISIPVCAWVHMGEGCVCEHADACANV